MSPDTASRLSTAGAEPASCAPVLSGRAPPAPPSPEREEMRAWAGEEYDPARFDPARFDLAAANAAAGSA
jgi:hypothetical protein